jgi:hypothetical protein
MVLEPTTANRRQTKLAWLTRTLPRGARRTRVESSGTAQGRHTRSSSPGERGNQANWLSFDVQGQRIGLSKYRVYGPDLGIFISRDFLRYLNKYRAWSNRPVGQVDRDGLADADVATRIREMLRERRTAFDKFLSNKTPPSTLPQSAEGWQQVLDVIGEVFTSGQLPETTLKYGTDCGKVNMEYGGKYDEELDKTLQHMIDFMCALGDADVRRIRVAIREIKGNVARIEDQGEIQKLFVLAEKLEALFAESNLSDEDLSRQIKEEGKQRAFPLSSYTEEDVIKGTTYVLKILQLGAKYLWVKTKGPQLLEVDIKSEKGNVRFHGNIAFPAKSKLVQELVINDRWFKGQIPGDFVVEAVNISYGNSGGCNMCRVKIEVMVRYFVFHAIYVGEADGNTPCEMMSIRDKFDLAVRAAQSGELKGKYTTLRTP